MILIMGCLKLFKEFDMSKYIYLFLALGFTLLTGNARADEVTRSTSTRVESPDNSSSSSSTTTTTEDNAGVVNQESTTTQTSPGRKTEYTTMKKSYVPKRQRTVVKHTETDITR
jgi:hypothetical protein